MRSLIGEAIRAASCGTGLQQNMNRDGGSKHMPSKTADGSVERVKPIAADERVFLSPPHMSGRERELVAEAFESNFIAPAGPLLNRFEADLSAYTGFAHTAALTSGTAAIHLALRIAGIGRGDTVWSSTLTFIGGVAPILYQDAEPVFFDVDDFGLFDLDLLEAELEKANAANALPKAIILTDLYGIPCDGARARALCDRYGIVLVSDAAEAMGSRRAGQHAGHPAHFAAYSFNGNKIITTSGGGALCSNDEAAIGRARNLSAQAREPVAHYEHITFGYNYRLSNVCAAIGVGQLEALDERVARKRDIADAYRQALGGLSGVSFLGEPGGTHCNHWLSVMLLDGAECRAGPAAVIAALEAENIEARLAWKPMHLQPVFRDAPYRGGKASERFFDRGVCLPSGTAMSKQTLDRVIAIVHSELA